MWRGDYHDGIASRHSVLFRSKPTTEFGLDAHHREEVAADDHPDPRLRQCAGLDGERDFRLRKGNQAVEAFAALPDIDVVGVRGDERPTGRGKRACRQHIFGTRHRQWPEEERIGKAENGAVRADANRQRDDRDDRKARISCEMRHA